MLLLIIKYINITHIEKIPYSTGTKLEKKLVTKLVCPFSFKVPPASTSGLCFKKLNVTTRTYKLLINRLARKVSIYHQYIAYVHLKDSWRAILLWNAIDQTYNEYTTGLGLLLQFR